jgi:hypothetical protein
MKNGMIEKIKIVLSNLKNANAVFALLLFIITSQIFATILWYWNINDGGTFWFANLAFGSICGFLVGYRDDDGNELWKEEFHLTKKLFNRFFT